MIKHCETRANHRHNDFRHPRSIGNRPPKAHRPDVRSPSSLSLFTTQAWQVPCRARQLSTLHLRHHRPRPVPVLPSSYRQYTFALNPFHLTFSLQKIPPIIATQLPSLLNTQAMYGKNGISPPASMVLTGSKVRRSSYSLKGITTNWVGAR